MKKTLILLSALLAAPVVPLVWADVTAVPADKCPTITDKVGRAGMAAATLDTEGVIAPAGMERSYIMTGGANFPNAKPGAKTPAERGEKVYYGEILVGNTVNTVVVGNLPAPVAYAAYAPCQDGMIVAGGCNATGHLHTVSRIRYRVVQKKLPTAKAADLGKESGMIVMSATDFGVDSLPSLPVSLAYPAFEVVDGALYVMGGQDKPDATVCRGCCFRLDLNDPYVGWKQLTPMPSPRMLATAGVVDGKIYVVGGCSLHPDANGAAERTYLNDVWCYDPRTDEWKDMGTPAPETIVGAANPMPSKDGKLYLLCGDPGNFYRASLKGEAPADHPGQNFTVYSYCPETGKWEKEGENSVGVATAPAVRVGDTIRIISGETHPGVRTPVISTLQINK